MNDLLFDESILCESLRHPDLFFLCRTFALMYLQCHSLFRVVRVIVCVEKTVSFVFRIFIVLFIALNRNNLLLVLLYVRIEQD